MVFRLSLALTSRPKAVEGDTAAHLHQKVYRDKARARGASPGVGTVSGFAEAVPVACQEASGGADEVGRQEEEPHVTPLAMNGHPKVVKLGPRHTRKQQCDALLQRHLGILFCPVS